MNSFYRNVILALFLATLVLNSKAANGEYRVYQYLIKNKDSQPITYLDHSTLDPISYQAYHGGSLSITPSLLRTWVCKGNTSNLSVCSPPLKPLEPIGPNL